jgi:RNA polymerase sigma factor (sigma-70 family)
MPQAQLRGVIQYLREAVEPPGAAGVSDGELLERFLGRRDESAFELLVRRHGGMVLGACRRLLRDEHEAEDAFQATFLALARKAGSIGRREAVGAWLYRVACRAARQARSRAAGRRERPLPDGAVPAGGASPEAEAARAEWGRLLDVEVGRLPEKYRAPFVLCELEGKSYEEAGRELGASAKTVSCWLSRARERLRQRLARRGVDGPGTAGSAALPAPLVAALARAAGPVATGSGPAAGAVPARALVLMREVLRAMFLDKLKLPAAVLLAVALAGAGAGALWGRPKAGAAKPAAAEKNADVGADKKAGREKLLADLTALEKQSWEALKKRDAATLKGLTSDDFVGIFEGGERATRAELLDLLKGYRITDYKFEDVRLLAVSKDVAILTYNVVYSGGEVGKPLQTNRFKASSTWARRGERWLNVFYQETVTKK